MADMSWFTEWQVKEREVFVIRDEQGENIIGYSYCTRFKPWTPSWVWTWVVSYWNLLKYRLRHSSVYQGLKTNG